MLLKSNVTRMPFKKVLMIRIAICVINILIGLKCILLVLLNQVGTLQSLTSKFGIELVNISFMQGFYTGFGGALMAVGIGLIIRTIILLKNPEKLKKAEIDYLDERNRFIKDVTFSTATLIFLVALSFATVVSGMFNSIVFVTLLCTLFAYILILLVIYFIVRAKH